LPSLPEARKDWWLREVFYGKGKRFPTFGPEAKENYNNSFLTEKMSTCPRLESKRRKEKPWTGNVGSGACDSCVKGSGIAGDPTFRYSFSCSFPNILSFVM